MKKAQGPTQGHQDPGASVMYRFMGMRTARVPRNHSTGKKKMLGLALKLRLEQIYVRVMCDHICNRKH